MSSPRTPLYRAQHSERYRRQELISEYEHEHSCRLAVVIGPLFDDSVTFFQDLLVDASPGSELHLLLVSPGGYGDAAIRMARGAQARCSELVVIVPDQAKSAATLLALGAHRIVMGPASDLGPVDPQFLREDNRLVAAKDIIAAFETALDRVERRPDTYPVLAALLGDVTALDIEEARSAVNRTQDQLREALSSQPDRDEAQVAALVGALAGPLITEPAQHEALFGPAEARSCGLPVEDADLDGDQWTRIWDLWTRYFELGATSVYESRVASQVM